jgi:hypothetical protein
MAVRGGPPPFASGRSTASRLRSLHVAGAPAALRELSGLSCTVDFLPARILAPPGFESYHRSFAAGVEHEAGASLSFLASARKRDLGCVAMKHMG